MKKHSHPSLIAYVSCLTFIRLCLYLGIEIKVIPPDEARRNSVIGALNHLWSKSYFSRNRFKSVKDAIKKQHDFLSWYEERYFPPSLFGKNITRAVRKVKRRKLTKKAIMSLPDALPLTRGRVHFIRFCLCLRIYQGNGKTFQSV